MPGLYFHKRRADFVLRRVQSNDPPGLVHRIKGRGKDVVARADGARYRNQRHRSESFQGDFAGHENSPQRLREQLRIRQRDPSGGRLVPGPRFRIFCMHTFESTDPTGRVAVTKVLAPIRASARVSFLTVSDDNYGGLQGRVALLVELEVTANAVELDSSKGVTHLRSIGCAGFLNRHDGCRQRVESLGMNVVRILVVRGTDFGGEVLRDLVAADRGNAEMSRVVRAFRRACGQFAEFRVRLPVRAEIGHLDAHLLHLLDDECSFCVARPVDHEVRARCFNTAQLAGEIEIAARVTLFGDNLEAVFLSSRLETLKAALAEVVVDVNEGDLFLSGELLVDEVDEVSGERGVRNRRAEDPLVALRGDSLSGAGDYNLRCFALLGDLRSRETRRT